MVNYRLLIGLVVLLSITACGGEEQVSLPLDDIYKKYGVSGSFLLESLKDEKIYVYNESKCQQGYIPASTFKIMSTMIALETGVAMDENYPMLWDSVPRQLEVWNRDHTLFSAFQTSCVPCYQQIVGKIGLSRMQEWIKKIGYGEMDIQRGNLTNFWLKGQSKITPFEQLDFLKKLAKNELPLRPSTYQKINKIMTMMDNNGLVMKAKTGMAILNGQNVGWFVGIVERKDGERFVFVNNITSKAGDLPEDKFMMARKAIVGEVLKQLGVI